jgi:hypothetical protein
VIAQEDVAKGAKGVFAAKGEWEVRFVDVPEKWSEQ